MLTRTLAITICLITINASAQPVIEISEPQSSHVSEYKHNYIPVKGRIVSANGIVKSTVGDIRIHLHDPGAHTNEVTKEFAFPVPLTPGENSVEIVATDANGLTTRKSIRVHAAFPVVDDRSTLLPIVVAPLMNRSDSGEFSRNDKATVQLEHALNAYFRIADRAAIDAAIAEHAISLSDMTSAQTRMSIREIVSSELVLTGEIRESSDKSTRLFVELSSPKDKSYLLYDLRFDGPEEYLATTEYLASHLAKIRKRVTGTVKQVHDNRAIVDYTTELGLKQNTWVLFLKIVEEAFIDEDTGEVLSPATYGIGGRGRISRVQESNTMVNVESLEEGFTVEAGTPAVTW